MEAMTSSWTDDRIDDLKDQVAALALRTDEGLRDMRKEMNARFDSMDARFDAMNARFDAMNARFDAMQRVMIMFGASMFGAMMSLVAAFVAFQL